MQIHIKYNKAEYKTLLTPRTRSNEIYSSLKSKGNDR
jgi:hypothetical protein